MKLSFSMFLVVLAGMGCGSLGGSDAGGGDGGAPSVTLANAPIDLACPTPNGISPLPEEVGHWAATRLTPSTYPFTVDQVGYTLSTGFSGSPCSAELSHRVSVFAVSPGADGGFAAPPVDPAAAGAQVIQVASSAGQADVRGSDGGVGARSFSHTLPKPLTLSAGQAVFVAVEMAGSGSGDAGVTVCLEVCPSMTAKPQVDYWSNAASPPFPWADLVVDFGFPGNTTVRAKGR